MKQALFALLAAAALGLGLASCNPADLEDINGRIDQLEARVATLEQLNSEIADIKALITALQDNISVVSVTEIKDGYEILLSNNEKITIKNGRNGNDGAPGRNGNDGAPGQNGNDGAPGQNGTTPEIGVKAENGIYYWTVNGEYLLDGEGNKLRVSAAAAPKLKIEEDKWYISYDEGATWEFLAEAGVAGGDGIFSNVTVGEDSVTFILAGGATFQLPLASAFAIVMEQEIEAAPGETATVAYTVTGAEKPLVYCIAEGGYSASINAKTATTGDVVIIVPADAAEGLVIVFAESEGESIFKSIKVTPVAAKPAIEFVNPAPDGYEIVFDHTKAIDSVAATISWKSEGGDPYYILQISPAADMSTPYCEKMDDKTTASYSNRNMNQLVCSMLAGAYKTTTLYYRIVDERGTVDPSPVKNVKFTTEFDSFMDPRDGEIYPIAKIGDRYWMSENMRALTYADGSAFDEVAGYTTVSYNDGFLGKRAGVYYSWGHAMHGWYEGHWFDPMLGADAQEQGVCPDGWHVTSANDFDYMLGKAAEALGKTYSGSIFDESYQPDLSGALRFADDFSALAEGCTYTNDLGLYFVPANYYAENTASATAAPSDYGWGTHLWTSTMVDGWSSRVFQANQWNNLVFSYHYGNNSNGWSASMPVRCVKNY